MKREKIPEKMWQIGKKGSLRFLYLDFAVCWYLEPLFFLSGIIIGR
jgi:hypothetical protein